MTTLSSVVIVGTSHKLVGAAGCSRFWRLFPVIDICTTLYSRPCPHFSRMDRSQTTPVVLTSLFDSYATKIKIWRRGEPKRRHLLLCFHYLLPLR